MNWLVYGQEYIFVLKEAFEQGVLSIVPKFGIDVPLERSH